MTESLYSILGVQPSADAAQIKAAYRTLSKFCHPNNPANQGDPHKAVRWEALSIAYKILSNEEARAHYDATGEAIEPAADETTGLALQKAIGHFMKALMGGSDVERVDLKARALRAAQQEIVSTNANIAEIEAQLAKMRKGRARLTMKGAGDSENPLDVALHGAITDGERVLVSVQKGLTVLNKAVEILDTYDYEHISDANFTVR